ncbi:MAG TPA: Gfo/Idh/MocA family oxidoreductase [Candidatus Acidoferrales bacterium]|nr:Gfo/Idh/MocA family oxidoreductase [Candidatus Acidoferrales bacterium]
MTSARDGAIIGFGNVAAHGHLPGWRERSDFRIVAVSDCDPQRRALAEQLIPGVRTYADSAALLRRERLDFVDIATPPAQHTAAVLAAANAGVHVLCEKPLTTSWKEYRAVRAAVQRAGVVLYTVDNWKYSEAFRVAREMLAGGALGALHAISFDTARNGCATATGDNWRVRASIAGGGILVDHGWHAFYLLLALANQSPQRIRATLERHRYVDAEVEDTALCAVDFPSLTAEIRLTWAASERHTSWHLQGDDGQLRIDDDELVIQAKDAYRSRRLATALSAGSHHPEWFAGVVDSFRRELDEPSVRGTNQAEAEWCLLMLGLAYASDAQDSRPLAVPERSEWLEAEGTQP